jgi:CheY-like chemotaxis protein
MSHERTSAEASVVVLVIDDEQLVRAGIRRILQQHYTVLEAANGAAGLALIDSRPDVRVVILDVIMPGMSGIEVLAEIRARRPDLPVLVSTACTDLPPQLGDAFLQKPYGAQTILEEIAALLAQRTRT